MNLCLKFFVLSGQIVLSTGIQYKETLELKQTLKQRLTLAVLCKDHYYSAERKDLLSAERSLQRAAEVPTGVLGDL